jgi:outer membrane protein
MPNTSRIAAVLAVAVAAMLASAPVRALETKRVITIEEAVEIAAGNNASLKREATTLEAKRRSAGLAWNAVLPSITASAGLSNTDVASGSSNTNTLAATGSLQASVSASPAFAKNLELAKLALESEETAYATMRVALELSVRKSFHAVILDGENLKLAKQNIARAEESYAQTEARYRAGLAPELDLLTAKVNLETLKPKASGFETALANDTDSLKLTLGLDPAIDLAPTGNLEISDEAVRKVIEAAAGQPEEANPSVAAARKALEITLGTKASLESSSYLPSLSLSVAVSPSSPIASTGKVATSSTTTSISAMAGLSLDNFLPWSPVREKIAEAGDSVTSARSTLEEAIRTTRMNRASNRRSVENYRDTLAVLKLNIELAQKTWDSAQQAYRNGSETLTALQSAVGDLESAKLSALAQTYDLITAVLALEYETGLPLDTMGRN